LGEAGAVRPEDNEDGRAGPIIWGGSNPPSSQCTGLGGADIDAAKAIEHGEKEDKPAEIEIGSMPGMAGCDTAAAQDTARGQGPEGHIECGCPIPGVSIRKLLLYSQSACTEDMAGMSLEGTPSSRLTVSRSKSKSGGELTAGVDIRDA